MTRARGIEPLLRDLAPQVLAILIRRHGQFDRCEDAVQEALLAAATQWPTSGLPDNPRAWLLTVATRRLTDDVRSEHARRRREESSAATGPAEAPAADDDTPATDDSLTVLFLCCHPALSAPSQVALTLRAIGGLRTAQIAAAFLVPEATMAQRITRAKQQIRNAGSRFTLLPAEYADRLAAVLHVLYLIFNEGYTATGGPELTSPDLTSEAIRLTKAVHRFLPEDGEVTGLLALMLLTDARRPARTAPDGRLIPLAEQDRGRWDAGMIADAVALLSGSLSTATLGPYQLQAAIAAVHDEAADAADTDWPQIVSLYRLLERYGANPAVRLNHAVAVAMVDGPAAGLELLDTVEMAGHRVDAVRAHLLEMAGDLAAARTAYRLAALATTSIPEQRYLDERAARL